MSALGKLARLRALTRAERRALATAAFLLAPCRLGLRVLGFARMKSWVEREPVAAAGPRALSCGAAARMVDAAARHLPFSSTCLDRSLLLTWMLRRSGHGAELLIGVRVAGDSLEAHAWVECGGLPVNESRENAARYAVFALSPT